MRTKIASVAVAVTVLAALIVGCPWNSQASELQIQRRADSLLRDFLKREWQAELDRDPTSRLRFGVQGPLDGWTPTTDERDAADEAGARRKLAALRRSFDLSELSAQGRLEYLIYEEILQGRIRQVEYRRHTYFFTRNTSDPYLELPHLLVSAQKVRTADDARQYIAKVKGLKRVLAEAEAGTKARARRGIVLPAFNFPDIAANSRAFISGRPCDSGPAEQSLWKDFRSKLSGATVSDAERERLLQDAQSAISEVMCPAYRRFAGVFEEMGSGLTRNDGLWSLRDGEKLYRDAIALHTSMDVDPAELHRTGLREVERIEGEVRKIMERNGLHGSIQEYFTSLRADPRYQLPQTETGRAAYLDAVQKVMDRAQARLPELFSRLPRRPLVVRSVEPERESALGTQAFYNAPTGGVGPGIVYIGLADMKRLPLWEIEPVAYHEGLPGHHFQISLAEEATDRSAFRRYYNNNAYQEGWALYAESLGSELGGYADELSWIARLRLDLLRAVRIVVETGFHHERWSWERGSAYLAEHLALPSDAARQEMTRYMVWPGQGVSYKLGELQILRLRAKAQATLGVEFDARDFHDVILDDGVLPFDLIEQKVDEWLRAATARRDRGGV